MALFGTLPAAISVRLWNLVAFKTTVSISNMPGPQYEGYEFLGHPIANASFWVPPIGTAGIFITVLSCSGRVGCSMCVDSRLMSKHQASHLIGRALDNELLALS
eukprot:TRINITY_DN43549_c0_g2_i3.p3 TRINITY_DN43549_c0_g2~~TRINITY_DN43549_c0_g2_i3.p3  ORF type:complete len:104 (+),score=23.11 TRINITY_DN43549_c0_g2_i3:203-514(+)